MDKVAEDSLAPEGRNYTNGQYVNECIRCEKEFEPDCYVVHCNDCGHDGFVEMLDRHAESHRIPTHDYMGQRVRINERATLFSPKGIHYEGTVRQIGGKRWLDTGRMKIGGIGNSYLMKG